jgi:aminoglycoside phosphotransferase (APT) family kinase protein
VNEARNGGADEARERTIRASLETTLHRDPVQVSLLLDRWLHARWPGARTTGMAVPGGSGASSELFFVGIAGAPFAPNDASCEAVLRLAPAYPVYPVVDLGLQAECMRAAVQRSLAPVPEVYAVETDERHLGAAFLLMQRMHGRGAPDWPSYVLEGWIRELPGSDQRRLWFNGVEAIAAVHATDIAGAGLVSARLAASGDSPLARMLDYWRRFLSLVREGGDYRALEHAVAWLERECPELSEDEGLVWGDASLRNMLFDGLRPAALMDFEFAHVGLRAFDIVFYALMDHVMARGFAGGAPRLPGFAGIGETLDYYESLTGRRVQSRDYMLRMALTYMSLATTRVCQRLAAQGQISPADVALNPPLRLLGEAFDGGTLPD